MSRNGAFGILIGAAVGTLFLVPAHGSAQEISRIEGSWMLNREASTFPPGQLPRREERTYEDRGDGEARARIQIVNSGGRSLSVRYTAKQDGSDYRMVMTGEGCFGGTCLLGTALSGGPRTTIAFTPVDAYTSDWVTITGGVLDLRGQSTVSEDGLTFVETDQFGTVRVFDRR